MVQMTMTVRLSGALRDFVATNVGIGLILLCLNAPNPFANCWFRNA